MNAPAPGTAEWRALVDEPVVDPAQRIVDPHHHLWAADSPLPYSLDDLLADVGCGHSVEHTVFMECGASYRTDGPAELAPIGETEFVADAAERSNGLIAGIVGKTDLRLSNLDEVLDAHEKAGGGRFRGIRDSLVRSDPTDGLMIRGGSPERLYEDAAFRAGVARL